MVLAVPVEARADLVPPDSSVERGLYVGEAAVPRAGRDDIVSAQLAHVEWARAAVWDGFAWIDRAMLPSEGSARRFELGSEGSARRFELGSAQLRAGGAPLSDEFSCRRTQLAHPARGGVVLFRFDTLGAPLRAPLGGVRGNGGIVRVTPSLRFLLRRNAPKRLVRF